MRARIINSKTLCSISPNDISAWLQANGWRHRRDVGNRYAEFEKTTEKGTAEVEVPLGSHFRDYPLRMAEILQTIEVFEGICQRMVLQDIRMIQVNVKD